jgi:peroxiredoxin
MSTQNFQDKLAELRSAHCDKLTTPELAALTRGTAILRRSNILEKCLQRGETAPNFTFIGQSNNPSNLYKMLENGPVLINFFRGYWCMYCNSERESLSSIRSELEAIGCQSLSISPQPSKTVTENLSESDEVIFDKNNQIADLFRIVYQLSQDEIDLFESWDLHIDEVNESGNWLLPLPATYLVSKERVVSFQFLDVDFRRRCGPNELLEAISQLK